MNAPSRRARRATTAAALAWLAPSAFALGLGDIEVRSIQGAPLEARIPVTIAPGETVRAACFSVGRTDAPSSPLWREATLELRRSAHGTNLLLRSIVPLDQRALALRVAFGCGDQRDSRDYSIELPAQAAVTPMSAIAQLPAEPGDTLAGIAQTIFPKDAAARRDYTRALHEANLALAPDAPIPAGTAVALPDLRHFARSSARATDGVSPARRHAGPPRLAANATDEVPSGQRKRDAARESGLRKTRATPAASAAAESSPAPRTRGNDAGFALKLSGPVLDLSASRTMSERDRAALRERVRMLDDDDAVAAMLAMRHEVAQLQARVTELQLKLASLPPSAPAQSSPPMPVSASVESAAVQTAAAAPKEPAAGPKASATPKAPTPAPKMQPAPDVAASPSTTAHAVPARAASRAPSASVLDRASDLAQSPRLVVALGGTVLVLLALWLVARARAGRPAEAQTDFDAMLSSGTSTEEPGAELEAQDASARPPEIRVAIPSTPEEQEEARRRYIAERFPEVASGAIDLDDADSVVKGARLFYEDGSALPAMELLQLAIERHPAQVAPWLALFEIYRRQRLTSAFAELAARFHEQHGERPEWRKVCYFGASIDPDNALYREETTNEGVESLDFASDLPPDPATEDWLHAGASDEQEALGQRLRASVMAGAGVREEDLQPNPIPALRAVEIFNVA